MRRWAILLTGAALWLFLAALPALADGGPHQMGINNGTSTLTADSCAGCHRAHTASGEYLITAATEAALCTTCHGASGNGATTDVMTGVQYTTDGWTTQLGALRSGGFDQARIDSANPVRLSYPRTATDVSQRPKVLVKTTPSDVTSSHMELIANGLSNPGIAWGNGANGAASPSVSLSCGSCHNPHGNGQYRILKPLPAPTGAGFSNGWTIDVVGSVAADDPDTASTNEADRILTKVSHALLPGDKVTIAGTTFNGNYFVESIGTDSSATGYTGSDAPFFRVYASGTSGALLDITADSTTLTGTVNRPDGVKITDSPVDNPDVAESDVKNYTVIQKKGTQGTNSTYLLYLDDVLDGPSGTGPAYSNTSGDYMHRQVPWYDPSERAPITDIASNVFTTSTIHRLAAANTTYIKGVTGLTDGVYTVATAPTTTTFTLTGVTVADATGLTTAFSSKVGGGGNSNVANDAPNGQPSTVGLQPSYSEQITAWCAQCHTRYFADRNPTGTGIATGSAWEYPRPGDSIYNHQHRTVPNRACVTCHVAHGSNATMLDTPGTTKDSRGVAYPEAVVGVVNGNSRLLKIDNRGTCQACHDPTGTITPSTFLPGGTLPSVP